MSVPEIAKTKGGIKSHAVKTANAVMLRDFNLKKGEAEYPISIEVFNNEYLEKPADKVGVTLYHPNKENPTHVAVEIFNVSVGTKEFAKQLKRMKKDFDKKTRRI